eukprot:7623-Heterococcus_DN1.PRE.1
MHGAQHRNTIMYNAAAGSISFLAALCVCLPFAVAASLFVFAVIAIAFAHRSCEHNSCGRTVNASTRCFC